MTREEQNKNWALLSEESKSHYRAEYKNRLEDSKREIEDPEGGGDLTVLTSQYIADDLEKIFGKHNLQPTLTYEDVARELYGSGINEKGHFTTIPCIGMKWDNKLQAIGRLLVVAKYLNKNVDGSDWMPDWENEDEPKWYLCIKQDNKINPYYMRNINWSTVYFRTKELAEQAAQILGEDVVRTALTTEY